MSRPALPARISVLDGGLSTQLERMGHSVEGALWTARVLADHPQVIVDAHRAFIDAGADIVITSSYQVSRGGFREAGRSAQEADDALTSSIAVARSAAAGTSALVAASIGPYGAVLHDGSEYRGNYGLSHRRLVDFHRERLDILMSGEPDVLAVETIPDVDEAVALAEVLSDHPDIPVWMTFSARDDTRVCAGQTIEEAVEAVAGEVSAVGINCTDAVLVTGLLERMRSVTDLPLVAYPNAGGVWDAVSGRWSGAGAGPFAQVREWRALGAQLVGGCCGTDAEAIRALVSSAE